MTTFLLFIIGIFLGWVGGLATAIKAIRNNSTWFAKLFG